MAKTNKKTVKSNPVAKKTSNKSRVAENVDCLFELHKLQGVLLNQLRKDVK